MSLAPGTRLGPYEVTAQIGVGGIGEVYRATDTNLKRAVALKVLPAAVASDPERLARFQREAEVLASLNHPNIAAIFGLERGVGQPARTGPFKASTPRLLFRTPLRASAQTEEYAVAPSGDRFPLALPAEFQTRSPFHLIIDWPALVAAPAR